MAYKYGFCDGFSDDPCGRSVEPPPVGRVLGCSQHVAYIQSKCNGPRLCELQDLTALSYDRRMDDISEASVEVAISGEVDDPCCSCLGDVEPWCHVLTIVREGDGVVWTGPVVKVTYGYNKVKIEAKDKLAWLTRRVNPDTIDIHDNYTIPLTKIAIDRIIGPAMMGNNDLDSPCFMDCIVDLGDGLSPDVNERGRIFKAFDGPTAYDDLLKLSGTALIFTVISQCLILSPFSLPKIAIGTLTDEHILGDVEIIKDATNQANSLYVRFDGDDVEADCAAAGFPISPCPAYVEGPKECYGLVERVLDASIGGLNRNMALAVGQKYLSRDGKVPRLIEFPSSTKLSPDTPWTLSDMIPGQRMDVAITKLCVQVFQSFQLTAVTVEDGPAGESIGITLKALEESG